MNKKRKAVKIVIPDFAGGNILSEIRGLIESARSRVASFANAELTMLYWHIGHRIRKEILKEKRAEYGDSIVATLSQQLTKEYGEGFSRFSLSRMVLFNEYFPIEKIVVTLSRQLGWSHFVEIIPVKNILARDFYANTACTIKAWLWRESKVIEIMRI